MKRHTSMLLRQAIPVLAFTAAARFTTHASADYVVHEWGTFTSVQAADGIQLEWNSFQALELPGFVYSVEWPLGRHPGLFNLAGGKQVLMARQRMETPVLYFYSPTHLTVDVRVDFPNGRMTEWYPQISFGERQRPELLNGFLTFGAPTNIAWNSVAIVGNSEGHSAGTIGLPPSESSPSHYYAAREVDANLLQLNGGGNLRQSERFLFYRGVGSFNAPLRVTQAPSIDHRITAMNEGAAALSGLVVLEVRNQKARFKSGPSVLESGATYEVDLGDTGPWRSLPEASREIAAALQTSLVVAGLFPREADAMVQTWSDSWFNEDGLRCLYVLPKDWVETVLPLRLDPAPRETVRVMVGRAELLMPEVEAQLGRFVSEYLESGKPTGKIAASAAVRNLHLGRFLQPAFHRLIERSQQPPTWKQKAFEFMGILLAKSADSGKVLAAAE